MAGKRVARATGRREQLPTGRILVWAMTVGVVIACSRDEEWQGLQRVIDLTGSKWPYERRFATLIGRKTWEDEQVDGLLGGGRAGDKPCKKLVYRPGRCRTAGTCPRTPS